jgi:chromosome segregation ATPase
MSVEQMKTRTTGQLAELGKKTDAINHLKKELGEKTAAIFALESRDRTLRDQLRATEDEHDAKTGALHEAQRTLSDKQADLARLMAELGERSILADSQRVELAALRTQIEAMKVSVGDYDRAVRVSEERLLRQRGEAEAVIKQSEETRGKLDGLATRTGELERELMVQTAEAGVLSRRVQELEARLGDQGRQIAQRDVEIERLRREADAAGRTEKDLRDEVEHAGARAGVTVERLRTDIKQLEAQLANAIDERTRLQAELSGMRRDTETSWATERVENALLRERINDVAAEVARLTATLEGPGSPIEAMLAAEVPVPGQLAQTGSGRAPGVNGDAATGSIDSPQQGKGTLADRIRALQSSASRVASN